jgi:HSP20 family protein
MFARYRYPLGMFADLRTEMDRLLDTFASRDTGGFLHRTAAYPALNVWDAGEALCVEAEVPGVAQDDLEIFAQGNECPNTAHRGPAEAPDRTFHRQERGAGEFSRVVTLPVEVDSDQVQATLKDGVLSLRLPKAESAKPRKIAVKTR